MPERAPVRPRGDPAHSGHLRGAFHGRRNVRRDKFFKINDPALILLWLICFAISLGGAALLRHVLRGGRARSGS